MVRAKLKTTGINEISFTFDHLEFFVTDVGGQRAERRKWFHCFEDVTGVIYLAALDEYDMKLEEDNLTNRFEESLKLFNEITASASFKPPAWILFLNKTDLLQEKIKTKPLNQFFPEISAEDGSDFRKVQDFFLQKYTGCFRGRTLYPFFTCALDTENCKNVFKAIRDNVVSQALGSAGF